MRPIDTAEFERLTFVVVPRDHKSGEITVEIVHQPQPRDWRTIWYAAFDTVADRDLVYDEMRKRRERWHHWGLVATFAGAAALNQLLLEEVGL